MGWTSLFTYEVNPQTSTKERNEQIKKWFVETNLRPVEKYEALKMQVVGNVLYAAVKLKKTNRVTAFIYVFSLDSNGHEYYYKDMDESVGPCNYDCPMSIIKLLTPTERKWANEWREKVKEHHKKKKERKDWLKNVDRTKLDNLLKYLKDYANFNEDFSQKVKDKIGTIPYGVVVTKSKVKFAPSVYSLKEVQEMFPRGQVFKPEF
ncbi:hypothetical protein OAH77_04510 [Flavobacteriaceae bacterium]|nr:hypothetical protein [Flavobacteriaceae bacterium]